MWAFRISFNSYNINIALHFPIIPWVQIQDGTRKHWKIELNSISAGITRNEFRVDTR